MLRRRDMLIGAGAVLAAPRAAPAQTFSLPPSGVLAFRIMRLGSQIGAHESGFETAGDVMTMRAETEIVVRLLGIPVFRFTHSVTERWQGGRLFSLDTRTNDDGTPYWVAARRDGAALAVQGSAQAAYTAPDDALPMTHWNIGELGVPKINPQKGNLLRPLVADRGMAEVADGSGGTISARHYNFSGDATLDVWFDAERRWAALAFLGSDQSAITLQRR